MDTKKKYYGAGSQHSEPISYWALVANLALPSVRKTLSFESLTELDELIEEKARPSDGH